MINAWHRQKYKGLEAKIKTTEQNYLRKLDETKTQGDGHLRF